MGRGGRGSSSTASYMHACVHVGDLERGRGERERDREKTERERKEREREKERQGERGRKREREEGREAGEGGEGGDGGEGGREGGLCHIVPNTGPETSNETSTPAKNVRNPALQPDLAGHCRIRIR